MSRERLLGAAVAVLCTVGAGQAHFVWIERDGDGPARAYFGEWAEDIREKTGGLLDRIKSPRAFLTDPTKTLPLERRAEYLEIAPAGVGDVRLVEEGLAPRDDTRAGGKTKTVFYAKAGRRDVRAVLDFELVPVAANSPTFSLLLHGQPLAKTEAKVYGPPKWEKSFRPDEQGRLTLQTPWAGRYVVEVVYVEEKPGEARGESYNRLRHVSTLSFVVEEGIAWATQ